MSNGEIKIGLLATLVGPYAAMGKDGVSGAELALHEFGWKIGDRAIKLVKEGTNAIPDDAVMMAEKLIDRDRVDFIVGPLSGNEGLAIRDFAKTCPEKVFINGIAAAQDITLRDAAPNFYHFCSNAVQWMAGVGTYAYRELGYRRAVTLAESYSYPQGQVGGFMIEFCRAGGSVVKKFWVAVGTQDFRQIIRELPTEIDVIYVCLAGTDAVNFLNQYIELGCTTPLIGGTTTVDSVVLNAMRHGAERLDGMITGGPIANDNPSPAWQKFVAAYRKQFSHGLDYPSVNAFGYYVNVKAALLGLQKINGEFTENQANFKAALNKLEFESPSGPVKLDHNRQGIATIYINRLQTTTEGKLTTQLIKSTPQVNNTLGLPEKEYLAMGSFSETNPNCP